MRRFARSRIVTLMHYQISIHCHDPRQAASSRCTKLHNETSQRRVRVSVWCKAPKRQKIRTVRITWVVQMQNTCIQKDVISSWRATLCTCRGHGRILAPEPRGKYFSIIFLKLEERLECNIWGVRGRNIFTATYNRLTKMCLLCVYYNSIFINMLPAQNMLQRDLADTHTHTDFC